MKIFRKIILINLLFIITNCASDVEHKAYSPPRFNHPAYKFDVANIVIESDKNQIDPLDEYSQTLEDSLKIWANDRLKAIGKDKNLKVIIKEAKIKNTNNEKFAASIDVNFEIYGEDILFPVTEGNFKVSQTMTMAENATLYERKAAIYDLITKLIYDFNKEIDQNIKEFFGNYLQS